MAVSEPAATARAGGVVAAGLLAVAAGLPTTPDDESTGIAPFSPASCAVQAATSAKAASSPHQRGIATTLFMTD